MDTIVIKIKNMVCHRCVMSVERIFRNLSIPCENILVGEVHLQKPLEENEKSRLAEELKKIGLELIDSRIGGLIESIKRLVIKKARNEVNEREREMKLSAYLVEQLHHEYTYLSSLFSDTQGRTIENYFIQQRIEKAKELLVYGQLSLSQIAFELNYSSVAHLSSQFKKETGLTPSHFKKLGIAKRRTLDEI